MRREFLLLPILVVLAGCSAEPEQSAVVDDNAAAAQGAEQADQDESSVAEAEGNAAPDEETDKPLDLSFDSNAAGYWDSDMPAGKPPGVFDEENLFAPDEQQKDAEVSFSVVPMFEEAEEDDEKIQLPEIDGVTVGVEVKTK
ncbi:MAG: hypothetical protein ACR2P6_05655 [Gammaproteobacteria bacterium]